VRGHSQPSAGTTAALQAVLKVPVFAVLLGGNATHGIEWIDYQTSTIILMIIVASPELANLIMS